VALGPRTGPLAARDLLDARIGPAALLAPRPDLEAIAIGVAGVGRVGVKAAGLGVYLGTVAQRVNPAHRVVDVPACGVVLDAVAVTHTVLLVFVDIIHPSIARCWLASCLIHKNAFWRVVDWPVHFSYTTSYYIGYVGDSDRRRVA